MALADDIPSVPPRFCHVVGKLHAEEVDVMEVTWLV
jgi:hypothetical protein